MPSNTQRSSDLLFRGLLLLAAMFALMLLRSAPPDPASADAPQTEFSAARAISVLRRLVGDRAPHFVGTEPNARVRERVVQAFTEVGYRPEIQSSFVCGSNAACATVNNVIVHRPGLERRRMVLLATHYDSVAAGPGASDAGVSVAAVLEVARALAAGPPHRNGIVLLVDDGEEAGLLGAEAFASEHPLARQVGAVVNLEARGTEGPSLMFETSGDNGWLIALLSRSLARPMASSLFYPIYERLPNDTDLTVFKRYGMPGVNFAFIGGLPRYHTPLDHVEHASPASLQHQGQNALAIVRALAAADLDKPPAGHAVFFDVLAFGIVRWPRPLTLPLAALSTVLVVATIVALRRRAATPFWRSFVGAVAWLLMVGLAALGTWGAWKLLTRAGAWPGDATTRPAMAVVAWELLGLGLALGVAALFERWARRVGSWGGCWLCWSLAACAAAYYVPDASYLLVVPALTAGGVGIVSLAARSEAPGFLAAALPLVAAAALWLSPAWFLFEALGPPTLPVSGTALALLATTLLPLAAGAGRTRWIVPALALLAAGALAMVSVRAPAFSAERPERMNIAFVQWAGEDAARWYVSPQSRELPGPMRAAAPFGAGLTRVFPWSAVATAYAAPTTVVDAPMPTAEVLAHETDGGRKRVRLLVSSPRGARTVMVLLPADRVVSVTVGARQVPSRSEAQRPESRVARGSLRSYACFTLPPEGIVFEMTLSGAEPVEAYLVDHTSGLPAGGAALIAARPREASPVHSGDVTVLGRRLAL